MLIFFLILLVISIVIIRYVSRRVKKYKEARQLEGMRAQCWSQANAPEPTPPLLSVSSSDKFSCQEEQDVNDCLRAYVSRINERTRLQAHYEYLEKKKDLLSKGQLYSESYALRDQVARAWQLVKQAASAPLPQFSSPLLELLDRSKELSQGFQLVSQALAPVTRTPSQNDIAPNFFHVTDAVLVAVSGSTGFLVFTNAYVLCVGELTENIRLYSYPQVKVSAGKWAAVLDREATAGEDVAKVHYKDGTKSGDRDMRYTLEKNPVTTTAYQGTLDIQCGPETYSVDVPSVSEARTIAKALTDYISLVAKEPHCRTVEQGLKDPEKIRLVLKKLREEKLARLEQEKKQEKERRALAVSPEELDIRAGVLVKWNCSQKKAALPEGLFQEIGENSIFCSDELEELTIPEGVRVIRRSALAFCASLRKVTLPDSLEIIGEWAFLDCKNLEKVTFGKNLREIGERAFSGCHSLKEAWLPNGLLKIGDHSFKGTGLEKITLPDSLKIIGEWAFLDCRNLERVTFGKNLRKIGERAFAGCHSLKEALLPNGLLKIGDRSFEETGLEKIALPDSLQTIGKSTFSGCESLKTVTFGKNLRVIGEYAFAGCQCLKEVRFPDGLLEIGGNSFRGSGLEKVALPDLLKKVGPAVFAECLSLKEVSLGEPMGTIPGAFFQNANALKTVTVHQPIVSIGEGAFENCAKFRGFQFALDQNRPQTASMDFPEGLEFIAPRAFSGCASLNSVRFPSSFREIGDRAFLGCSSLSEVEGLENISWTAKRAFHETPWLSSLAKDGFVVINGLLEVYVGQGFNVKIPADVTQIGPRAFENNRRIASVVIPEGVTSIGERAFGACRKLSLVQIPDSVIQIADNAFATCPQLVILCYRGSVASAYRIAHKIPGEYLARERKSSPSHPKATPKLQQEMPRRETVSQPPKSDPPMRTGVDVLSPEERKLILELRKKKREEQAKLGVDPQKDRPFEEEGFRPDQVSLTLENVSRTITRSLVVLRFQQSKPVGLFQPAEYQVFFADSNGRIISDVKTVKADRREGDLSFEVVLNLTAQSNAVKEKSCDLISRYPGTDHNVACKIPFQMNCSFV